MEIGGNSNNILRQMHWRIHRKIMKAISVGTLEGQIPRQIININFG